MADGISGNVSLERTLSLDGPHDRPSQFVAGGAALAAVLIAAWSLRRLPAGRLLLLTFLRVVAVACALVLFLRPTLRREQVARTPNRVAVLVDASGSMDLAEKSGAPTRFTKAQKFVAALDGKLHEQPVDYYAFGAGLRPTSVASLASLPHDDKTPVAGGSVGRIAASATTVTTWARWSSSPTASTTVDWRKTRRRSPPRARASQRRSTRRCMRSGAARLACVMSRSPNCASTILRLPAPRCASKPRSMSATIARGPAKRCR